MLKGSEGINEEKALTFTSRGLRMIFNSYDNINPLFYNLKDLVIL